MEITYYVASSLDGFIAEPDGGIDFLSLVGGEPDPEPYEQFFSGVDALLMGRRTYDQVLGFGEWPYGDRPCWVMTHRALNNGSDHVVAIDGTPSDVYQQIAEQRCQHLWLVGGADLASQFLQQGLIDRIVVSVMPVVLGSGIPLFSRLVNTVMLTLVDVVPRTQGIVELTYTPGKK